MFVYTIKKFRRGANLYFGGDSFCYTRFTRMGEKSFFGANKEEDGWEGEGDAITLTAVGKNCMGNTAWRGKHREGRVSIGVFFV